MNLFKSKKVTRLALAGAFAMTLLSGCEYDYVVEPTPEPITTELKFSSDIIPIFNESCLGPCHSQGSIPPDLSPENAYNSLVEGNMIDSEDAANSLIYTVIKSGSMKMYAKTGDAEKILAWIEQGAKNN